MRLLNAFKIALANYGVVFKNLLYKLIILLFFGIILGIILRIRVNPLVESFKPVLEEFKKLLSDIFKSDSFNSISATPLNEAFNSFLDYLSRSVGSITVSVVITFAVIILFNYMTGISDCTLIILVNNYMSSLSHMRFSRTLISNLKKIMLLQLVKTLFDIVTTAIILALFMAIIHFVGKFSILFALFLAVFEFVCLFALKIAFFSKVMTSVLIGNESFKKAFIKGLKPTNGFFGKMFVTYLNTLFIYIYLFVTVTVFTFGAGLVLLIPLFALIIATLRNIDWYVANEKKYFIDYDTIIVPKSLRQNDERLLNKVDI